MRVGLCQEVLGNLSQPRARCCLHGIHSATRQRDKDWQAGLAGAGAEHEVAQIGNSLTWNHCRGFCRHLLVS